MSLAQLVRPKIAVLMEFPTALGGERSLLAVAERLTEQFEFLIFAPPFGALASEILPLGLTHVPFTVRDLNTGRKSEEQLRAEATDAITSHGCDLVHANSVTLARFAGRNRTLWKLPTTAHLRDIMSLSAKAVCDLNQLDGMLAVSQATSSHYQGQGVTASLLRVCYNGIDPARFAEPPTFNLRRELHLPDRCQLGAIIGQIGLRKGHDLLFESIIQLAPQHPDWHFLVLGERYSEKQESVEFVARLESMCREAGLEERIHWLGYMNDIPSILSQVDLLIHPARQEPFGRVLLEAAVAKVPIVATAVGGTAEMLVDGESARLVESENLQALTDACARMMQRPDERTQLANAAFDRVGHLFSLQSAAAKHADFWQEMLAKS